MKIRAEIGKYSKAQNKKSAKTKNTKGDLPTFLLFLGGILLATSCLNKQAKDHVVSEPVGHYQMDTIVISKEKYQDQLYGFWLGQCIANWTGLVTEMDKIGNVGEIKTGDFYSRDDWGQPDQPSIWAQGVPSDLSPTIDFVFRNEGEIWGADDDTDIEYMYQHLHSVNQTSLLSPTQIREGWLTHIKKKKKITCGFLIKRLLTL